MARWPLGDTSWCSNCAHKRGGYRSPSPVRDDSWCDEGKTEIIKSLPCNWLIMMAIVLIALLLATMYYRMREYKRNGRPPGQPSVRVASDTSAGATSPMPLQPQTGSSATSIKTSKSSAKSAGKKSSRGSGGRSARGGRGGGGGGRGGGARGGAARAKRGRGAKRGKKKKRSMGGGRRLGPLAGALLDASSSSTGRRWSALADADSAVESRA